MRRILLSSVFLLAGASPVLATPFTINAGTDTTAKSVTGTDTGTVAAGASLSTSGTAITWSGPSNAPGVTINNSGTISSSASRGIDTSGSNAVRNFTLNNNAGATLSGGGNDAFRINTNATSGTITVNNSGTIISVGRQALDFDAIAAGTATVNINNNASGLINATTADAIRPGQAATVTNFGNICAGSGGACSGGVIGETTTASIGRVGTVR